MQAIKEVLNGQTSSGSQEVKSANLAGKTALITGGTAGIGLEVAKALATAGARVIILSRKRENGDKAIGEIKAAVRNAAGTEQDGENGKAGESNKEADVEFIPCDLGNLNEVKEVTDNIAKKEQRLDILVAGTGIGVNKFDENSDGIDRHFGVNHLGHFLLVNRLLPLMVKTTKFPDLNQSAVSGRIISISSELHRAAPSSTKFANVNEVASLGAPKDANESKDLSAHGLYGRSKLANIAFTRMLVNKVIHPNKYKVIVMATHPGAVHTAQQDQFKEAYGEVIGTALKYATIPFMKTPDQGSASTVWAAVDPSVEAEKEKWQGAYVTNPGEKSDPSSQALDDEIAENLWKLSKQLIEEQVGKDGLADWDMTTIAKVSMV